jgi:transposase
MRRATPLSNRRLKKLPEEVEALRQASPEASLELWSQDEHRIGLKPILRRVWARKGTRVRAIVRQRYQWMYLYGLVEPQSGKTSWLLMPTVNTVVFSLALAAFAQEQGVGPDKHILLVLDQAGWHTSADLQGPDGLHLLFLPSHSPELQPAERVWPLTNEPLANRVMTSLDELEQVQAERCRWLQAHPELIRARTFYHWWPAYSNST